MQAKISPQNIIMHVRNHSRGQLSHDLYNIRGGEMMETALGSDIGQLLLGDAIKNMNSLAAKVLDFTATEEDRAAYKAYREIVGTWARRIELKEKTINKIKEKKHG